MESVLGQLCVCFLAGRRSNRWPRVAKKMTSSRRERLCVFRDGPGLLLFWQLYHILRKIEGEVMEYKPRSVLNVAWKEKTDGVLKGALTSRFSFCFIDSSVQPRLRCV